ncbi:MAG TPA: type II secretion system protein N [Gammaproteobacteria bacterium]
MPSKYAWLALGIGAYVAFALSTFPAATAYRLFAPETVRLAGVEGTVWSGGAAVGSVVGLPLRDVSWQVDALPLLTGRVAAHVEARLADGVIQGDVRVTPRTAVLRNVRAGISVAALSPLVPLAGVEGQLRISLERAEIRDGWPVELVGEAQVAELAVPPLLPVRHPGLIPLGGYELTFAETPDPGILGELRDTGGPLEVTGTLALEPDGGYRLAGLVAARAGAPPELVQGLELMTGPPEAGGKRPFELTGSLRPPASSGTPAASENKARQ